MTDLSNLGEEILRKSAALVAALAAMNAGTRGHDALSEFDEEWAETLVDAFVGSVMLRLKQNVSDQNTKGPLRSAIISILEASKRDLPASTILTKLRWSRYADAENELIAMPQIDDLESLNVVLVDLARAGAIRKHLNGKFARARA